MSDPTGRYNTTRIWITPLPFITLMSTLVLAACAPGQSRTLAVREAIHVPGGDVERGQQLLQSYSCGSCHIIPGIKGANGTVGPPLTYWSGRVYIAGTLPNTPENLILWIQNPQAIEPMTAMPDVGVNEREARDIAAYLYTIDGDD